MALQFRFFGYWELLTPVFENNPDNIYNCRWRLTLLWTPYRWAQWMGGPSIRKAYIPCWVEGDHFGEAIWEYDGAPVSPTLACCIRERLSAVALQREAQFRATGKLPTV